MDTKALRQKILDLAIRGKLVPQDPNDEPASVLLERIRAEKQQMVKEGKLKAKDIKGDTIIFKGEDNLHYEKFQDGTVKCIEDEIPFEVPEGWSLTRFSAITINRDNERKPISSSQRTDVAKIYDYYGASGKIDKIDKYIFNERLLLIGEDGANLVTRSKPIAFFAEGQYWVNNHAHCIDATDKFILEYLCFYINAISLEKYVTGSAQPKMTQDNMNSILIPLPPYSEQKRMSQRLNEVMYTVNNIEIGKTDISELVSKAKSKILDLAIRGKLVPQGLDDEPASVLLERIRTEKEELIKQGKIKRDKKESIIFRGDDNSYYENINGKTVCINEEIPFYIPKSWRWVRLSDIAQIINGDRGQNYPAKNKLQKIGIPFVSASNIDSGIVSSNELLCMTIKQFNALNAGKLTYGDIVYCIRGSLGKCGLFLLEKGAIASSLVIVRSIIVNPIITQYVFNYLNSPLSKKEILKYDNGSAQPNLAAKDFMRFLIPIPPLCEQDKINRLLQNVDYKIKQIESNLL